jgi:GNAT superfamily N-acetyltransferase
LIRPASVADLPRLHALAESFYASSKFLRGFELERFVSAWSHLLAAGGVIFLLVDAGDAIAGALGGVLYPDLYSGRLVATEFFWFVDPARRGGGLKLYRAFEAWARAAGAHELRMVHLLDSMPDKLERTYKALGFAAAEIHYSKDLTQ